MESRKIHLLVTDVDGTLLDPQKRISEPTIEAIRELEQAGIHLSIVSHRPLPALKRLMEKFHLRGLCAALNGGIIADEQFVILIEHDLRPTIVQEVVGTIEGYHLDPWLYTRDHWYVSRSEGPHVQHEAEAMALSPLPFESLGELDQPVIKVSAVGDDYDAVRACENLLQSRHGVQLSISRPRSNVLDISHGDANKGVAVTTIAHRLQIPLIEVASAGDGENDIPMLRLTGRSIAMGQAPPDVHRAATDTTTSNSQDGLAWAIRHIVLAGQQVSPSGQ
jgi:Cof subfamily protein (haloacid dehalogenase superfamily)